MLRSQGIVAGCPAPPDGSGNVQFEGTGHDVAIYGGIPQRRPVARPAGLIPASVPGRGAPP